jgi:hypothetical protein
MMRALLLGAFATTAFGDKCGTDIGAVACRNFASASDFEIDNQGATDIQQTGKVEVNGAIQYIGDAPWDKAALLAAQTANGCQFTDTSTGGNLPAGTTSAAGVTSMGVYTCAITGTPGACTGSDANTRVATREYSLTHTLQHMVEKLDNAGRFELYFQRVLSNPIASTGTLKWIAENACKIYVDVEFECTGGNCVEVTTIVCASFAGISTANNGVISIECKVPNNFAISKTNPTTVTSGANLLESGRSHALQGSHTDDSVWDGTGMAVTSTTAVNSGTGTAVLTTEVTTADTLAQNERFSGDLHLKAWVCQGTACSTTTSDWTTAEQTLHIAKYNLTRASNAAKTFDMPVNVLFYSETSATPGAAANVNPSALAAFSAPAIAQPFLAKTKVEYGTITTHDHAYLSVVAKVSTDGTPIFKDLHVSNIAHSVQGAAASNNAGVVASAASGTKFCSQVGGTTYHLPQGVRYPQAYLSCSNLMNGNGPLTPAVTAGDTLVISLKWKIAGTALSNGAGKAALLQDAADEVQSVEVSLTIQLGGGETTITTAGGSDGSADPTVTYIIIAVCIVAAGLILAVVVVAFMCMRNRSQEAIVSMSPQKCTVAAVYDISQPKKADAMDV